MTQNIVKWIIKYYPGNKEILKVSKENMCTPEIKSMLHRSPVWKSFLYSRSCILQNGTRPSSRVSSLSCAHMAVLCLLTNIIFHLYYAAFHLFEKSLNNHSLGALGSYFCSFYVSLSGSRCHVSLCPAPWGSRSPERAAGMRTNAG